MRLKIIFTFHLLFVALVKSQVLISPHIVFIDNKTKVGSFIVQNESNEIYEIGVSFIFGYPVSDSMGTLTMHYVQNDSAEYWSVAKYARVFPRKFYLQPGQRQVVRISVKAPDTLQPGTYWTRIVTSSIPITTFEDSSNNEFKARLKFQLNQVTTCLYRIEPAETILKIDEIDYILDSLKLKVKAKLKREGNSPFFGYLIFNLLDENKKLVSQDTQYVAVYFDLIRDAEFNITPDMLNKNLTIELQLINTEKSENPESRINYKIIGFNAKQIKP